MSKVYKEDLYTLLGVDEDADDRQIKKAYRKLALKLHPDKYRGDDHAAAEAQFKDISEAYQVLMDPQERAWYDAHKDSLVGDDEDRLDAGEDPLSRSVDFKELSSSSAFSGYDDGSTGFYQVFSAAFAAIDALEARAKKAAARRREKSKTGRKRHKATPESKEDYARTPFGDSGNEPTAVLQFYEDWRDFHSHRDFAFADKWNLCDAENRRMRRAMAKENQEVRKTSKKAFNKCVQDLVRHVRKLDPRYIEIQAQAQKEREEKQKRAAENEKIIDSMRGEIDEQWKQRRDSHERQKLERQQSEWQARYGGLSAQDSGSESEAGEGKEFDVDAALQKLLACKVCKKTFRSSAPMVDHFNSKKHKKTVRQLRSKGKLHSCQLCEIMLNGRGNEEYVDCMMFPNKQGLETHESSQLHQEWLALALSAGDGESGEDESGSEDVAGDSDEGKEAVESESEQSV